MGDHLGLFLFGRCGLLHDYTLASSPLPRQRGLESRDEAKLYSCIIDFQIRLTQTFVTITNDCACVGRTQLTDAEPAKEIPLGWYDCGDGLYNPQNRVVYTYEMQFLRNAGRNQLRD